MIQQTVLAGGPGIKKAEREQGPQAIKSEQGLSADPEAMRGNRRKRTKDSKGRKD